MSLGVHPEKSAGDSFCAKVAEEENFIRGESLGPENKAERQEQQKIKNVPLVSHLLNYMGKTD